MKAELILNFCLEYGDDTSWFGQVCPSAPASWIGGLHFILRMPWVGDNSIPNLTHEVPNTLPKVHRRAPDEKDGGDR